MRPNLLIVILFYTYLFCGGSSRFSDSGSVISSGLSNEKVTKVLLGSWINQSLKERLDKFEFSDSLNAMLHPYRSFTFVKTKRGKIIFIREVDFEKLYKDTVKFVISKTSSFQYNVKIVKYNNNSEVSLMQLDMHDSLLSFVNSNFSKKRYTKCNTRPGSIEPLYNYFGLRLKGDYMIKDGTGKIVSSSAKFKGYQVSNFENLINYDFGDAAFFLQDATKKKYFTFAADTKNGGHFSYACSITNGELLLYTYENLNGGLVKIGPLKYKLTKLQ